MKRTIAFVALLVPALWFLSQADAGKGKGHPKGGGGGGGGGHFGGGSRPAPVHVPTPSVSPSFNRPAPTFNRPVTKATATPPIHLPGNFNTRPTLPKTTKPPVVYQPPKVVIPKSPKNSNVIIKGGGGGTRPNIPGSNVPITTLPGRVDVGKWQQLPGARPPFKVGRPTPAFTKQFNKKFVGALAVRPPKIQNQIKTNIANYNRRALAVRNHLGPRQLSWFTPAWWRDHPYRFGPYWHYRWHVHPWYYWWRPATWALFTSWIAADWGQPIFLDYGTNVVIQDGIVYVNGVPVASVADYAAQAIDLATVTPPPQGTDLDWLPMGTFALSSSQQDTEPNQILQLVISKEGLISGTSFNPETNEAGPVEGRVDPATQRVAIRLDNNTVGIYNLTTESTPVLIHFGIEQTQTWFLVRLQAQPQPNGP
ncbi:MAG TPA: hypothetical protein VKE98_21415 [Gemmataceae bacterium]|nr:hypothetical protein [Gemmataceae bacterium]